MKRCTKCGEEKPLEEFRQQKQADGSHKPTSACRVCLNAYSREYMREYSRSPESREASRARDKARYERMRTDPEKLARENERKRDYSRRPEVKEASAERAKAWVKANPERAKENQAVWRAQNPDKMREYTTAWREKNKNRVLDAGMLRSYERRWRIFNQGSGVFTALHVALCRAFWDNLCAYCGTSVEPGGTDSRSSGFDHVVPLSKGGGHGPENIVVCCFECNTKKNNRLYPEATDRLLPYIEDFIKGLPQESYRSKRSAIPLVIKAACKKAETRLRGLGMPVGTWW
jgi:5-methylcytosine-specific restriction endonuclease McrA